MAIDTLRKRASALTVGMQVYNTPDILPDGSLTLGDWQQIGWGYRGIPTTAPVVADNASKLPLQGVGV